MSRGKQQPISAPVKKVLKAVTDAYPYCNDEWVESTHRDITQNYRGIDSDVFAFCFQINLFSREIYRDNTEVITIANKTQWSQHLSNVLTVAVAEYDFEFFKQMRLCLEKLQVMEEVWKGFESSGKDYHIYTACLILKDNGEKVSTSNVYSVLQEMPAWRKLSTESGYVIQDINKAIRKLKKEGRI